MITKIGFILAGAALLVLVARVLRNQSARRREFYQGDIPEDGAPLDEDEDRRLGQIAVSYCVTAEEPSRKGKS